MDSRPLFRKFYLLLVLSVILPFKFVSCAPAFKEEVASSLIGKLNSDRISYFFGSYGIEPVPVSSASFQNLRISNLHSVHEGKKVMRTLAVVQFIEPLPESLKKVHEAILGGQSMGIALRQDGWTIDKAPVYFGSVSLSSELKSWMQEDSGSEGVVHIYRLDVSKNGSDERLPYCTIIEVHSPQYLDAVWLRALHPGQEANLVENSKEVDALMGLLQSVIEQLPSP
jgi:hypothetical protein